MSDARNDILSAVKAALKQAGGAGKADTTTVVSVSYTHLTLPTICSV